MVHTPKGSAAEAPNIPDGLYELEVVSVALVVATEPDPWGNIKDKLRIRLHVLEIFDENGEDVHVDPLVNNSLSDGSGGKYPASTYWKICVALGLNPEGGVDSDDLVGRRCRGTIVTEEGHWPKVTQWMRSEPKRAPAPSQRPTAASQREPSTDAYEKHMDEMDAYWKKVVNAGIVRSELIEQSKFTYEKEPFDLTSEQRQALYDMMLPTVAAQA